MDGQEENWVVLKINVIESAHANRVPDDGGRLAVRVMKHPRTRA